MADTEIRTDPQTVQRIGEQLEDIAIQAILPTINEANAKIYNYSYNFLKDTVKIIREVNSNNRLTERLQEYRNRIRAESDDPNSIDSAVTSYYGCLLQALRGNQFRQEKRDEYYKCIMNYQKNINEILGQTVQMTFVFEDTGEIDFINDTVGLLKGYDKVAGKFKYNLDLAANLEKTSYDFTSGTNFKIEDTYPLRDTYLNVIRRYRVAEKITDSNNKEKEFHIVLYRIDNHWHGVWVKAGGDISQAYASYALNHIFKPFQNKIIERRVEFFLFGVENGTSVYGTTAANDILKWRYGGVIGVDNESGFLAGDVSLNSIEYGVKGVAASSLGVQQIFDFAEQVVNKKGDFSIKDLRDWKENRKNRAVTRNRLHQDIETNLESALGERANDFIEDFNRIKQEIIINLM